jgi:class 3 adenylate cyclase/CHASE2 domain-containing sensor protein
LTHADHVSLVTVSQGTQTYTTKTMARGRIFRHRHWRSAVVRAFLLGTLLTLLAVTLDWGGKLGIIDRWFYDWRARHCQFFTSPPIDKLVHVDIDDAALEEIGRWPWPRTTLAEVVDEIKLSGADALALDIMLTEPEPPGIVQKHDGTFEIVDHDGNLATALARFKKLMVPVQFNFEPQLQPTPQYSALLKVLHDDLELPLEQAALRAAVAGGEPITEDIFLPARREAMNQRLREAQAHGGRPFNELLHLLLPHLQIRSTASSIQREFETQYRKTRSMAELTRFAMAPGSLDPSESLPPFLTAHDVTTMALPFAQAASCSGYVDYLSPPRDPVIRAVPICIMYRGQLYPQMDLALACAELGVDPRQIKLSPGKVMLPRPNGQQTVIPVHEVHSDIYGTVGAFVDIPWFGGSWETMYDYPNYRQRKQHIPITLPWALADTRRVLAHNNEEADKAMQPLAEIGLDSAKAFLKNPLDFDRTDQRIAKIQEVINEATPLAAPSLNTPANQLNADDKFFLNALSALRASLNDLQTTLPQFKKKAAELHAALDGKVVLIGGTATGLFDSWPTPLQSKCPGAVIHGVVFNALMTGHFWRTAPPWMTWAITIATGLVMTLIMAWSSPLKAFVLTLLLAPGYLVFNSIVLFDYGNWIVGVGGPIVVMVLIWGTLTLTNLIIEAREKARITRRFRSYVDPRLVNYLIEHPEVGRMEGEVREMTVVFSDLAGFTTFTEKLREKAVKILGRYMVKMVPPIREHHGLIHRFMGDGIMFSYNAPIPNPNMADDAVATILEMHANLAKLNEELVAEGYPALSMRIGINTAMAVIGDSGSEEASEYACLGDATNTAARLEGANSATGTHSLISARTVELLAGKYLVRPVAKLLLVGKTEGIMTYEPLVIMESAIDAQKKLVELTTTMVDHYLAGRFQECITAADHMDEVLVPSKLTNLYRQHCQEYLAEPPVDFQGCIVLRQK